MPRPAKVSQIGGAGAEVSALLRIEGAQKFDFQTSLVVTDIVVIHLQVKSTGRFGHEGFFWAHNEDVLSGTASCIDRTDQRPPW